MHPRLRTKPLLFEARQAHADGAVSFASDGSASVMHDGSLRVVARSQQFDLAPATLFGLNERLTAGATSPRIGSAGRTLRDLFNDEWQHYTLALDQARGPLLDYGWYAYYPEKNHLVRYASPYWHEIVATASSSKLIADPAGELSWHDIREVLRSTVLAIAGCSVGSSIAHAAVMDLRPRAMKVADKSRYKMENINRVRLGYADMVESEAQRRSLFEVALKNKARTFAEQVYAIDPFIDVFAYEEGITEQTIAAFFEGDGEEPPASMIIEEIDDPRIKLRLREEARRRRVPLLMMTDIGSSVQFDILRYDRDATLPLSYGITDEALYAAMEAVYDHPGDRRVFFAFVDALISPAYRQNELAQIIEGKSEIPTSTIIPQLGSTAQMAGAIAAEAIARIRLGHEYPSRFIFNKFTLGITIAPSNP